MTYLQQTNKMTNSVYIIPEANVLGKLSEFDRSRNSFYNNANSDFDVMGMKSKHQNTYFKTTNEHVVSEKTPISKQRASTLLWQRCIFYSNRHFFFSGKNACFKMFHYERTLCFGRIIFSLLVSMLQANTFPGKKFCLKATNKHFFRHKKYLFTWQPTNTFFLLLKITLFWSHEQTLRLFYSKTVEAYQNKCN